MMEMTKEGYYRQLFEKVKNDESELKKTYSRVSNIRLAAIVLGAVLFYFLLETSLIITVVAWIVILAGFYRLVKYHERLEHTLGLKVTEMQVIENELEFMRSGGSSYSGGEAFINDKHPYSTDLDVFGDFSLFKQINRSRTAAGMRILSSFFLKSQSKEEIEARQQAVKELKEKREWILTFQSALYETTGTKTELLQGLETPPKIKFESIISAYRYLKWLVLPVIAATFYFGGIVPGMITLFGITGFHFWLAGQNSKETEPYFDQLRGHSRDLNRYEVAVSVIMEQSWESELLRELAQKLKNEAGDLKNPIRDFQVISKRIDMKNNQFAAFFLYILSPFDLVELIKMRNWIDNHPDFFQVVFETIGGFEALGSLGVYAFNQDNWTFPEIASDARPTFKASALGHPLIKESVCNDFELSTTNRLSLITGSNMSGKSTFLRTIGCNILLAYAGAPCFARNFVLTEGIELFTYMRIRDSLMENASTFKAEIERIRLLLDALIAKPKALLLVDEMLRGTNSEDKLKGSIAFLKKVVDENAFALVATHDLRTTELAVQYPDAIKTYFFEYDSKDGELTFDYDLKEGVCKSFNASELLRRVGLNI